VSENLCIFYKNVPSENILVLLLVVSWCLWRVVVFHYQPLFTLAFWWCNCFWMYDRALRPCSLSVKIQCVCIIVTLTNEWYYEGLQEKISPCYSAYFTWAVELKNEPIVEIVDNGATCNTSLITRTLNWSKNIYATLYEHYVLKATVFFLTWGKLFILISDVLQTEASCMTFLTAVHCLMML